MLESATSLDVLTAGLHGLGHPLRVRALVLLEAEQTPKDLAATLGVPLGLVSYHVRALRDCGLLIESRTELRRGALAHYYRRTELADRLLEALHGLLELPRTSGERRRADLADWALAA
jgi:DNA-binding transcriptional ArsR family regulator